MISYQKVIGIHISKSIAIFPYLVRIRNPLHSFDGDSPARHCCRQRSGQVSSGQVRSGQVRLVQIRSGLARSSQSRARLGQGWSSGQVRAGHGK